MERLPKDFSKLISIDSEIHHVVAFVRAAWDTDRLFEIQSSGHVDPLEALVRKSVMAGYNSLPTMVDHYSAEQVLKQQESTRRDALAKQPGWGAEFPDHDGLIATYRLLRNAFQEQYRTAYETKVAAFDSHLSALKTEVEAEFRGLLSVFPNDYAHFTQGYRDFDGMAGLDPDVQANLFHGHDCSIPRSDNLSMQLSMPHVAYNDLVQGRSPDSVLVSTLFHQGAHLREYNNTVSLLPHLARIADNDQGFSGTLHSPVSNDEVLQYTWRLVDHHSFSSLTQQTVDTMRAKKTEWEALTPEEKSSRRALAAKDIISNMKDLESDEPTL